MRICLAGQGAFGQKHLAGLARIHGVEVVSLSSAGPLIPPPQSRRNSTSRTGPRIWRRVWRDPVSRRRFSPRPHRCTRTRRNSACARANTWRWRFPWPTRWPTPKRLVRVQQETGLVAMAGHTRRFNPSHQWIRRRIQAGDLVIQQMDVQTYFFRRTNINAAGQPRSWTDHLLWHHACHTVDLFQYQTGEEAAEVYALQGPMHPELGIAMDMGIGMKAPSGAVCTLSLSFNNDGPLGTFFRYICDNGTYIAPLRRPVRRQGKPIDVSDVDVSMDGIELQDREFLSAIEQGREPQFQRCPMLAGHAHVGPAREKPEELNRRGCADGRYRRIRRHSRHLSIQ